MQIEESRSKQFLTRKAFTAATSCFAMMGFTSTCWGAIVPYISEKNNFSAFIFNNHCFLWIKHIIKTHRKR